MDTGQLFIIYIKHRLKVVFVFACEAADKKDSSYLSILTQFYLNFHHIVLWGLAEECVL